MATYKVLQDIEAEDKLLGPLSFRQFIYGCITAMLLYFCFLAITKHAAFLVLLFLPIAGLTGFFAWPWGRDQPTEVWALAKVRFLVKPRRRIWDQSGTKELVTITAPKKVEPIYTNGLSETEVRSRLQALADTIDTRGWAVKNVALNEYSQVAPILQEPDSDRLIDVRSIPQEVPTADVSVNEDVLDATNNPVARHLDQMINASAKAHRDQLIERLRQPQPAAPPVQTSPLAPPQVAQVTPQPAAQPAAAPANPYWFMNPPVAQTATPAAPPPTATFAPQVVSAPAAPVATPTPAVTPSYPPISSAPAAPQAATPSEADEAALLDAMRKQEDANETYRAHLHTIQPISVQQAAAAQAALARAQAPTPPVPKAPDPAILALATNDDLNVATIARQAQKQGSDSDEVVISLH